MLCGKRVCRLVPGTGHGEYSGHRHLFPHYGPGDSVLASDPEDGPFRGGAGHGNGLGRRRDLSDAGVEAFPAAEENFRGTLNAYA